MLPIDGLLVTKLAMPRVRRALVPRPRLIRQLNAALDPKGDAPRRLTLLSAPPGFGKTTLVTSWIAQLDPAFRVAWVTLDEGDADPIRFWSYVIAALGTALPGTRERSLALLRPAPGTSLSASQMETLLTVVINDIAAQNAPVILVLDDYHLAGTPGSIDTLTRDVGFLLDHLPAQMHVVMTTRTEPELTLSRLRGRNELLEFRAIDLAFTPEETALFLNEAMGLELSTEDVKAIDARVEGWPAGLQMAALMLQKASASPQPVEVPEESRGLAGLDRTERYAFDYLADEVLSRQAPAIQDFLLRTSILDRLCSGLCDAVVQPRTGEPASDIVLRQLDRDNLFITPVDEGLMWYRYHPLFAELLRRRLHASHPDLVPTLHREAGAWYEQAGMAGRAIDHALLATDVEGAASLIERHAEAALGRSENLTVLRWIEALPDELIRSRPALCIYQAWAFLLNGQSHDLVEARLQQALHGERTSDSGSEIEGAASALRSLIAVYDGRVAEAADLAGQALSLLPETSAFLRTAAANNLGMANLSRGDLDAAAEAFEQVVVTARQAGNVMMAVVALCNLAGLQILRGHLRLARDSYAEALAMSTPTDSAYRLPVAGRALMGLGELAREWNDLETAATYLEEALQLFDRYGGVGKLMAFLTLARIRWDQHESGAAEVLLANARSLASATLATQMDDRLVQAAQVRAWLTAHREDALRAWAKRRAAEISQAVDQIGDEADPRQHDVTVVEAEGIVLARVHLALGRPDLALSLTRPLKRRAQSRGATRRAIEILVLEALALDASSGPTEALATLGHALALAEPEGYIRSFVDEGAGVASLLVRIGETVKLPAIRDYLRLLLAAFSAEPAERPLPNDETKEPRALPEPLSDREIEVLHLIAQGKTNREIGSELFISLDTVKGHTRRIYGKLGVHSRTQAVAQARALGLLT